MLWVTANPSPRTDSPLAATSKRASRFVAALFFASCAQHAPDSPSADLANADSPVRASRPEVAPEVAELVGAVGAEIEAAPQDAARRGKLGLVYEANSLWPEALASFEQAIALAPREPLWRLHSAIVLAELDRDDDARSVLESLARDFPSLPSVEQRLGENLLARGDFAGAESAFKKTVELAPKSAHGWVGLGEVKLRQNEFELALEPLSKAVELQPNYGAAAYLYGQALRGVGRMEEAARWLQIGSNTQKVFITDPGTARLAEFAVGPARTLERARDLMDRGRNTDAIALLERALVKRPRDLKTGVTLACAYSNAGRVDDALKLLEEMKSVDPKEPLVPYNVAACELARGRWQAALNAADAALALSSELASAHLVRGRALVELGRFDESEASLRECLRLEPKHSRVRHELGELYARRERWKESADQYDEQTRFAPNDARAFAESAVAHAMLGEHELAATALATARALAPHDAAVDRAAARVASAKKP